MNLIVRVNKATNNTLSPTLAVENDSWGREIQSVESGSEEFDDDLINKWRSLLKGDEMGRSYLGLWNCITESLFSVGKSLFDSIHEFSKSKVK
jgi:hypothetical protein